MFIECAISQTVPYEDARGTVETIALRPGRHNYPMLNPTDPLLADTLRVLRKHSKVRFDDLLPSDKEILKGKPDGVDAVDYLAEKVLLKPSPVGRGPSKMAKKKKVKSNVGRNQKAPPKTAEAGRDISDGNKPGGVSGKK